MTIEIKATEQYFPVVMFIMLYNMVPTFESVDPPNESCCILNGLNPGVSEVC